MTGLAPYFPGGAAEQQRPEERDELHQQDRRDQHRLAEAELLGAVRRRGGDHGLDAVVEEEVGDQEGDRDRVVAQVAQRRRELAEARLQQPAGLGHDVHRRVVAQPAERDDRERRPPHGRRQHAQPDGEALAHAEAVVEEEHHQVDHQQQPAAEVAPRPAPRGDAVALVLGGDHARIESLTTIDAPRQRLAADHRDRADLPVLALHEEQQRGERRAGPREAGEQPFLSAVRSATAPSSGSSTAETRVEKRDEVQRQRTGGDRQPEHADLVVSSSVTNPQAAFSAIYVMYGANITVAIVVT